MKASRAVDKEIEQLCMGDSIRLLPPSEQEDTLQSLKSDLDETLEGMSEQAAEIRSLKEKVRRRDARICELEKELREARKLRSDRNNAWTPNVVLLGMCFRGGLGLETTGQLIFGNWFFQHAISGFRAEGDINYGKARELSTQISVNQQHACFERCGSVESMLSNARFHHSCHWQATIVSQNLESVYYHPQSKMGVHAQFACCFTILSSRVICDPSNE